MTSSSPASSPPPTSPPPPGGLPPQGAMVGQGAVFTEAYAVLPRETMSDITASLFPGWREARGWVLARPLSGFAETFSEILMEIAPGGGADSPEDDPRAQSALYILSGEGQLRLEGAPHTLDPGAFAWIAPGARWQLEVTGAAPLRLLWIRKRWRPAPGLDVPESFCTHADTHPPAPMPGTDGAWTTRRLIDPADLAHDMHVNIVHFAPGAAIPFPETHVMEHGLFILEGQGLYLLNRDWVEVKAGDFLWLRAFCPQACIAKGPGPFRYLLYKDVNRLPRLDGELAP